MPAAKIRYHYRRVVLEEMASFMYNHTINYLAKQSGIISWLAQTHGDRNFIK